MIIFKHIVKAIALSFLALLASPNDCYAATEKDNRRQRAEAIDYFIERGDWAKVDRALLSEDGFNIPDLEARRGKNNPGPNGRRCKLQDPFGAQNYCNGGCTTGGGCWSAGMFHGGHCLYCDVHGTGCQSCGTKCWPITGKCQKDKPWGE